MTDDTHAHGPKYEIDIEGQLFPWNEPTITTEQIISLGKWDSSQGVLLIDLQTQAETTLAPGQVVEVKPGIGFSKKVRFKRGDDAEDRVQKELAMLRGRFSELEYTAAGRWIRLPRFKVGKPGWNRDETEIAFQIPAGFPAAPPYGIYVPVGIRFNGAAPASYTEPAPTQPAFAGPWAVFSWTPEEWRPASTPEAGSNLLNWVLGFSHRFAEGA